MSALHLLLRRGFKGYNFVAKLCDEGAPVGDFIYAIRNPRLLDATYEDILEKARLNDITR